MVVEVVMFQHLLLVKKPLDDAGSISLQLGLHNFNLKSFSLMLIAKAVGYHFINIKIS